MCLELIIMSTMTQYVFNSEDKKWLPSTKHYWKR